MVKDSNFMQYLPDRNDTDIPANVQWLLSLCEVKVGFYPYAERDAGSEADRFCEGVVDYWWDGENMVEPTFDGPRAELWDDERRAYQRGAIVGYELAQEFNDEE